VQKNNPLEKNLLICGDNLNALDDLIKKGIRADLIYLDPPFFSNRHYEVIWGDEAEVRSFKDRWEGGINVYIEWMKERVVKMRDVLKDTGSIFLHCDWHAGHYLKVMLDDIFGYDNFRNEVIWQKIRIEKAQSNQYAKIHDNIFFYSKSSTYIFNQQRFEPSQEYIDKYYTQVESGTGKRYQLISFLQGGQGPTRKFGGKLLSPPTGRHWIWSQERIDKATQEGLLVFTDPQKPRLKRYLDEYKGRNVGSIWDDIYPVNAVAEERLGYPTQKPEALLERIIKTGTNEGDVVLDPFCGCGTAVAASQRLSRKWIGIDISPTAVKLMEKRVEKNGAIKNKDFEIIGMPTTLTQLRKLEPFEFQNWVINEMKAKQSRKLTSDFGLDGFYDKTIFTEKAGIQVKQSESVGRNVVDNFETALARGKFEKGFIVAFSFSKGAHEEAARVKSEGVEIRLIEVEDLLLGKVKI
jgi:adenine specific DNA methylase Mod